MCFFLNNTLQIGLIVLLLDTRSPATTQGQQTGKKP